MRWKRVAWAGCLAPALGGCHATFDAAHDLAADKRLANTEAGIERGIRKDAREAWQAVRCQYPRKAFTPEFRDGFLDGYADYLDRGGDAQPPAVPPPRYTRNKRYFTPEGHALIRDYFLGFKYGVDVAVATGQRQYLTVPVLIPEACAPLPLDIHAGVTAAPEASLIPARPAATALPLPAPRPMPAEKPTAGGKPAAGVLTGSPAVPRGGAVPGRVPSKFDTEAPGSKFLSGAAAGGPPAKVPPLPPGPAVPAVPPLPPGGATVPPPKAEPDGESKISVPTITKPDFTIKLPEPPREVPGLPAGVPTPPAADDFPPIPPNHTAPPPLPANHPDDARKGATP